MNTLLRLREWVIPGTISLLLLIGCSNKTTQLESSGDAEMDQTAAFSLSIIEKLEDRPTLETPSEIVNYMTSTAGTAELSPPAKNTSPTLPLSIKDLDLLKRSGFNQPSNLVMIFFRNILFYLQMIQPV